MSLAGTIRRLLPILLLAAVGCRSGKRDLLEAELRTKERMLREAQSEVERTRLVNEALERDFLGRQQGIPVANSGLASPKDITLANGTGGVDRDNLPGDECLCLIIVPRDEDGHPVRVVGALSVAAWEILPGGVKVPLSEWNITADALRKTWKSGLLGSGYQVYLDWKKPPVTERLRVAVQLSLPDGHVFEADKDISIRPLPGAKLPPHPEKILPPGPPEAPPMP